MTRKTFAALASVLALALPAVAATPEAPWPPPPEVRARMAELQAAISDPQTTTAQRRLARQELIRLLRAPAAPPVDPDKPRPARAAIDPFPSFPSPEPAAPVPAPPVARVVPAPRAIPPFIDPQSGRTLIPHGKVAIDPATGRVLQEVPGGYIDGATGRFVPAR